MKTIFNITKLSLTSFALKALSAISFVALLLAACTNSTTITDCQELRSPNGDLALSFMLDNKGTPLYSLDYKGKAVVLPSSMGFKIRGDRTCEGYENKSKQTFTESYSLTDGFVITDVKTDSFDETWETVWGEERYIRNNYKELIVTLRQIRSDLQDGENYKTPQGAEKTATSSLLLGATMQIEFRLYDDGLGFRYIFPKNNGFRGITIQEEMTQFTMAGDHKVFAIPGDYDTQEYLYTECLISEIANEVPKAAAFNAAQCLAGPDVVQTALQMKTADGLYLNIHEAAVEDFPTMHLKVDGLTFTSFLTPDANGWKGRINPPFTSPWRSIQVVDDARKVLASRLTLNLNEPCALEDVSWIHPVKYIGVWWEMISGKSSWCYTDETANVIPGVTDLTKYKPNGRHGATTENVKKYIDYAAKHGFDAVLIEGWNVGWENCGAQLKFNNYDFQTPYPDFDLPYLNKYAHSKGLRLIMHHETSASVANYERYMEQAYSLMNKYGYNSVKSGYVGDIIPVGSYHYCEDMNNHYNYAVRLAAKHHIMVNAHEAVRPTGLCRKYPNMTGNESARGTEFHAFGGMEPKHTTILPFTRLQGGPMDYTPGIFEMDLSKFSPNNKNHVNSTICNQLGLYLTMPSPLQMACDLPENYEQHLDAFQFIKDVALSWERSEYLLAEPGDYIVVARTPRKSSLNAAAESVAKLVDGKKDYVNSATKFSAGDKDVWFVGGITDEVSRELTFSLDFLKQGLDYEAIIYRDAPEADGYNNPTAYVIEKRKVKKGNILSIMTARAGGFAVSIKQI